MKKVIFILSLVIAVCNSATDKKQILLSASREAPLGHDFLTIYSDSTFEYEQTGVRIKKVYPGKVEIHYDTLFFHYSNSIPRAGSVALFNDKFVSYIDSEFHEGLQITLSKLHSLGDSINYLVSPAQFVMCKKTIINGHRFYYAKRNDDTVYLMTFDTAFKTPEGFHAGMKFNLLPDSIKMKTQPLPGWAYHAKLSSGWELAFFEGREGTTYPPNDTSYVGWVFKRN